MNLRRRPRRNLFVEHKQVRRRRFARLSAIAVIAVAITFLTIGGTQNPARLNTSPARVSNAEAHAGYEGPEILLASVDPGVVNKGPVNLEQGPSVPPPPPEPDIEIVEGRIKSGQTASALLNDYLSAREIHEAALKCREVYALSKLKAGRPYRLEIEDGRFKRFIYEIDDERMLVLSGSGQEFEAAREDIHYDVETVVVHNEIRSSLFEAVDEIGESPSLAVRLSEIFAWDIDFVRDIRKGDSFRAVVQKRYRDGEFAGYGAVTAAMFVNQDHEFKGFLYADKDGRPSYFEENGRSLRKAFLKAPLAFSRISSGYSMSRLHPILKVRRPHPGIDYAAPRGTPVKAVGDGIVVKAGWDNGGGRFVRVRHNSVYETSYMHLSGFARGVKSGARVSQGQVIGYVGSTGLSTGPHLDFRMKKNGSYVNPGRIVSPPCEPVPKEEMKRFLTTIAQAKARLEAGGQMQASAGDENGTALQ